MNKDQFTQIGRLLRGGYPAMFKDDDAIYTWTNALIDLDGEDTIRAIKEYMQDETGYPTIASIRGRSKAITKQRNEIINNYAHDSEYFCPKCKDSGWTFWVSPTGIEMADPCNCSAGKKTYYAKSEEERRQIDTEEARKGMSVAKIMTAPRKYYEEYVYGKKEKGQERDFVGADGSECEPSEIARRILDDWKKTQGR